MAKKFYKCSVCGDVHYGEDAPEECPTCGNKEVYRLTKKEEARKSRGL